MAGSLFVHRALGSRIVQRLRPFAPLLATVLLLLALVAVFLLVPSVNG